SRPQGWTSALFFLGGLPYLLGCWLFRDRLRVGVPLCEAHKNHFRWRAGVFWGGLTLLPASLAAVLYSVPEGPAQQVCLKGLGVAALVWCLAVLVNFFRGTAAAVVDDDGALLAGVSDEFARAYEAGGHRGGAGRVWPA